MKDIYFMSLKKKMKIEQIYIKVQDLMAQLCMVIQKNPPLWLKSIMEKEMKYFHDLMLGGDPEKEFVPLTDGTAATASIATADALTMSLKEDRKVNVNEIIDSYDIKC